MFINDELLKKDYKIIILNKEYSVKFEVRNFLAAKDRYNLDYEDFLTNLLNEDKDFLIKFVWTATLNFDKFNPSHPYKVKNEINTDDLERLSLEKLKNIYDRLCLVFLDTLFWNEKVERNKTGNSDSFNLALLYYIVVSEMGFSEEFFFTSTLKTLFAILNARKEYSQILFDGRDKVGNLRDLDKMFD